MKKVAIILVNYKDYAEKYLADCINSLRTQQFTGQIKIFIVDNESGEESYGYLKKTVGAIHELPQQIEIIRNKNNDGFAKGNNDAMKLALKQGYDFIILFNMDTIVEPNCVNEMVRVAENTPPLNLPLSKGEKTVEIGAVQARIMLWPDKDKINSLGNVTHFLGFGYSKGYKQDLTPTLSLARREGGEAICYPSGAAVLYKAEALRKVGLFDEEFWMYNEDQDLGWRLWLAGYKCVLAPNAVVYHKYEFSRSIKKYYFMDRNRVMVMLKNYHWLTLVLIFPAWLIMEIGLLFFSNTGGWLKEKMEVYKYFLSAKNWQYIFRERTRIQKSRLVKDEDIVKMFSGKIWYQEVGDSRLKIANPIFNTYWQIIKSVIWW